jgi:pyridoxal phosphate-dependent aminotransferase EpsN
MKQGFQVPMSYTPIDSEGLCSVLTKYEGIHPTEMVSDFENELSRYTGARVVCVNSGTSALHLALKLLNVSEGDYVLAPSFTYVATINPILYEKAIPVLIDSERVTWNMDPALVESALKDLAKKNNLPKAIIVAHIYGMPALTDDILKIANQYGVPLIEDAAEALGSRINDHHVGTFGRVGILSFNLNKTMTTYGGGALMLSDDESISKVRYWASQSRDSLPYYLHQEIGYNYKMSPLNAAFGLLEMSKLPSLLKRRTQVFDRYVIALKDDPIDFLPNPPDLISNRWLSLGLLQNVEQRNHVSQVMLEKAIETRPLWKPMHQQPVFRHCPRYANGVSEDLFSRGICLPSSLSSETQTYVIDQLKMCFV